MRWYERTKFLERASVTLLALSARLRTAPRIDLSIVFERRRLPQTFVYKREYRSSYRRLERLNAPRSTLHYVRLFSPPRIG